jgi:Bacterial PH domain
MGRQRPERSGGRGQAARSEQTEPPALVRARPRRIRVMVLVAAPVIVVVFTLIAIGLQGDYNEKGASFQTIDQVAMILLGVLAAAGSLIFARPWVEADAHGVRVRNLLGFYDLPWEVVRAVTFGRGAPWVILELDDDDRVAVLAVQAADKEYAVRAARGLRALHAAAQARTTTPGD